MANAYISWTAAAPGSRSKLMTCSRRVRVSAIAEEEVTATMKFSEAEWEDAFKKASLIAVEMSKPFEPISEAKLNGKYFTDAEWYEAFERAALLYVAPDTAYEASTPVETLPEGRYFSDEQWNKAFRLAAVAFAQSQEETVEDRPVGMFTEEEWNEAFKIAAGALPARKRALAPGYVETAEIVNGRLAMLAFVSGFAAEKCGGGSITQQFASSMPGVGLAFVFLTVASCISIKTVKSQSIGPFRPSAEMLNGRAAMVGFAVLLLVEGNNFIRRIFNGYDKGSQLPRQPSFLPKLGSLKPFETGNSFSKSSGK